MRLIILFMLIVARVGGFIQGVPMLGTKILNKRTKAMVVLAVSSFFITNLDLSTSLHKLDLQIVIALGQQFLVGFSLGMIIQIMFQVFVIMGEIVAMQAGMGMAVMNDPTSNATAPVVSQFFLIFITILFFYMDAHIFLLKMVSDSFTQVPLDFLTINDIIFKQIAMFGNFMYANGMRIAIPMVTALMTLQLALGVATKSSPQLNIFTIGFPLTMLIGFWVISLNIDSIWPQFERLFFSSVQFYDENIIGGFNGR